MAKVYLPRGGVTHDDVLVIFHRSDHDGLASFKIVEYFIRKFSATHREIVPYPYNYNEDLDWDIIDKFKHVFMCDISPDSREIVTADCLPENRPVVKGLCMFRDRVINNGMKFHWIDHHESAIKYSQYVIDPRTGKPFQFYGIRDYANKISACGLATVYIKQMYNREPIGLEHVMDKLEIYIPKYIRLMAYYDAWNKDIQTEFSWDTVIKFTSGYRFMLPLNQYRNEDWNKVIEGDNDFFIDTMDVGRVLFENDERSNTILMKGASYTREWEGLSLLVVNKPYCNSITFEPGFDPNIHDAALCYYRDPKTSLWKFSIYGFDKEGVRPIDIAVKYGGGGHLNACGFSLEEIPKELL